MAKIAEVQEVSIENLVPYEKNAKIHNEEQLEKIGKSIQEFGFVNPCLIDKDYNIIAGHGRVMAAKKIGMKAVPCVFIEGMSEEQRRAYIIADNRLGELADWDMEMVNMELKDLQMEGFDIDLTGFDLEDLEVEDAEVKDDDYDVEPPAEPKSKLGEIYQLGRHRLMCGDSTSVNDVQALAGGAQVDLLLTDPPYGVDYTGGTKEALKIENDNKPDAEFVDFLCAAFSAADTVMKPGACFYIWHADSKGYVFRTACQMAGWTIRQCLVWVKNSMVLGRQDYQWRHEPCLYGWKEGAGHLWASDRKQTTVLEFQKPQRNAEHPTMKPVPLFDYLIKNNTKGGDIVLDLFAGSGTTIIAAEQNGRTAYCMEYDPKYVDVIIDRWEKLTGEKAVLINEQG